DTSGFNIIIDDAVNGLPPLTISLTNIPWDQALDTIMSLGDLVAFKHANILTVKTAAKAREERAAELASQNVNKQQEPLVTKVFPISFAKPEDISQILEDYITKDRGAIKIDNRTSNIIVKDTIDAIERMKKIIQVLDSQTPQVLIEAKVVEAREDYEFRAGLARGGIQVGYDPITDSNNLGDNTGSFSFNSATDAGTNLLTASIDVYKRLTGLNFSLQLMESESKGKVISSPKIITQNNEAATINAVETQRFLTEVPTTGGQVTSQIQEIPVTIDLTVTPKVTNDGSISMNVNLTKGGFGTAGAGGLPNTTANNITTNVLVDNGSTVVIGGLYQTSTSEVESGVPFLKDLPLVGWLFRNAYNPNRNRSELIVFLTPRIINQEEAGLVDRTGEELVGL
ncbi:MAG: secretin N-terminal domain-containing protein, partial [Bacteriovoracaceae bacterium]